MRITEVKYVNAQKAIRQFCNQCLPAESGKGGDYGAIKDCVNWQPDERPPCPLLLWRFGKMDRGLLPDGDPHKVKREVSAEQRERLASVRRHK